MYRAISSVATDTMLSFENRPKITWEDIKDIRDNSRYFGWANVLRGALYLPVFYLAWQLESWFTIAALVVLLLVHVLCTFVEIYRNLVSNYWLMTTSPEEDHLAGGRVGRVAKPEPSKHWFFSPKRWDSIEAYRLMGVERFRKLVVDYTNATKFTKAERAAGRRVEYVKGDKQSIINYEFDTRIGEVMHAAAWLFNVPPFLTFLWHGMWGWLLYVSIILLLDGYLVLLQRYNRARVHKLLHKLAQPRGAARKEVAP